MFENYMERLCARARVIEQHTLGVCSSSFVSEAILPSCEGSLLHALLVKRYCLRVKGRFGVGYRYSAVYVS